MNQSEKAAIFHQLHQRNHLFLMPNPWDAGSTKILTALGFEALATTSAGYAFSRGKLDKIGVLDRTEALSHAAEIAAATHLPVSADLENGFGASPEDVAITIEAAAAAGLAGCSIEDTSGNTDQPIYPLSLAIERIVAAVEAVNKLETPFTLTARAENFLHNRPDLDDTLDRLLAFESAGADVLYAPGLPDLNAIRTVCQALEKPVNVVAGIGLSGITAADLEKCGVRRISVGSSLARTAIGATIAAANSMLHEGSFEHFERAAEFSEIESLLSAGNPLKP